MIKIIHGESVNPLTKEVHKYSYRVKLPHDKQIDKLQESLNKQYENSGTRFFIRNHYYCENVSEHPLVNRLPMFYKTVLCTTLLKAVENNLDAPVANQLCLLEETAIVRTIACEPLAEYSSIIEKIEKIQEGLSKETDEAKRKILLEGLDVAKQLRDNNAHKVVAALETVKEFVEKAAKIDAGYRDKFSIHSLHSVVAQITNLLSSKLHANGLDHIAVEIEEAIRNELVMPLPETSTSQNGNEINVNTQINLGANGTTLTPDIVTETVKLMDSMIPAGPASE